MQYYDTITSCDKVTESVENRTVSSVYGPPLEITSVHISHSKLSGTETVAENHCQVIPVLN